MTAYTSEWLKNNQKHKRDYSFAQFLYIVKINHSRVMRSKQTEKYDGVYSQPNAHPDIYKKTESHRKIDRHAAKEDRQM